MDGASIYELLDTREGDASRAAVPTVWLMLLQHLEETGKKLPYLKKVVIGGSACPRAITRKFQENYDVDVIHAWGMTEMSPLGTLCTMKPEYAGLEGEARLDIKEKQGHAPFGVEMKVTDDDDRELPWNGKTFGRLRCAGRRSRAPITAAPARSSSMTTAGSTPATSPISTPTATCRSPTAPRT